MLLKSFLSLSFLLSCFVAEASWRPLGRYYKLINETEALITTGEARERELNPRSIKTLIWNIKKAKMYHWPEEFKKLGEGQDLFLVQEAMENVFFYSTIHSMPGIRWDFGASFLYRIYGDAATGNMIGSVAEPNYVRVEHTEDYEPAVDTPKSTTYAKYDIADHTSDLLVISVHGINLTNFASFRRHMRQVRAEIEKHEGPVVLAGDFNTRTYARTQHLKKMIQELKFTPVEFKNSEHRMRFKFTPYYLDHGFVRNLKVKSAEVHRDFRGSDHLPMTMELEVDPAP